MKSKVRFTLIFVVLIASVSFFVIANASYVTGFVQPNGYISTTWALFETQDTHPYAGYNMATANPNGCFTASVQMYNGDYRVNESSCFWLIKSKTASITHIQGTKTYPYASWLGQ